MSKLPLVDSRRMERLLFQLGFEAVRRKGSHVFYRHPDGGTTTLPHHAGRPVARPLLRKILQDAQLSPQEYIDMTATS